MCCFTPLYLLCLILLVLQRLMATTSPPRRGQHGTSRCTSLLCPCPGMEVLPVTSQSLLCTVFLVSYEHLNARRTHEILTCHYRTQAASSNLLKIYQVLTHKIPLMFIKLFINLSAVSSQCIQHPPVHNTQAFLTLCFVGNMTTRKDRRDLLLASRTSGTEAQHGRVSTFISKFKFRHDQQETKILAYDTGQGLEQKQG